jgi:hypothetical protein
MHGDPNIAHFLTMVMGLLLLEREPRGESVMRQNTTIKVTEMLIRQAFVYTLPESI